MFTVSSSVTAETLLNWFAGPADKPFSVMLFKYSTKVVTLLVDPASPFVEFVNCVVS